MCKKVRTSLSFLGLLLIVALTGCGSSGGGVNSSSDITPAGAVSSAEGSVNLGAAGNFALLAKTGVDTVPTSSVNGNVGVSPADKTYLTGWSQTDSTDVVYATSPQVTAPNKLYSASHTEPTPTNLTAAVLDMEAAYTDAAGRLLIDAAKNNIDATTLGGVALGAGVYKWDNNLHLTTDVFLEGSATDVWIIQVGGTLEMDADLSINLTGDALPQNVFWQVAGATTIGTGSHFEGVVLDMTDINFLSGATINGRLLSQTAINLIATTVTVP